MIKDCINYCNPCIQSSTKNNKTPVANKVNAMIIARGIFVIISVVASVACLFLVGPIGCLGLLPVALFEIFRKIYLHCATPEEQNSIPTSPSFSPVVSQTPFVPGQPVGLTNTGNNCWMNAGLQLLMQAAECHDRLKNFPIFKQFLENYNQSRASSQKISSFDTHTMRQFLFEQNTGVSSGHAQEDASVLFEFLFGGGVNAPYQLNHYREGYATHDVCGSMVALHIPRTGRVPPFQELLDNYFDYADDLDRPHQVRFDRIPQGILIQGKRFYQDHQTQEKINHLIDFPQRLELPARLVDDGITQENTPYHCDAFLVHHGSLNGGHYVAYIKRESGWWYCSDSSVYKVRDVSQAIKSAYILHYAR